MTGPRVGPVSFERRLELLRLAEEIAVRVNAKTEHNERRVLFSMLGDLVPER